MMMMPFAADGSIRFDDDAAAGSMSGKLLEAEAPFGLGGSGGEYYVSPDGAQGEKRRVRIALKSMPQAGGEGGEWEVQIC
jgi:hypothetical protein